MDEPLDEPLTRAITAVNLLETTVFLMEKTASLVAQTRDRGELERNADYAARCIARPQQTRAMARDFLLLAAQDARRRLAHDEKLTRDEYVEALSLVGVFAEHAARHFGASATA
jgi:hypothetical protein